MPTPGLLYQDYGDHIKSLLWDFLVFAIKSFIYILEAIYLTIIPDRFRKLKNVENQVVLITGGAGGVGRELAIRFAEKNAVVVIWDLNAEVVQSAISFLKSKGLSAKGYVVDISDREAVYKAAAQLQEDVGPVDILINNAGIVCCKPLLELPDKMIEKTYAVNILSHYWTIKSFLPQMIQQKRGHIVTIASVTGLIGTYGCTDYGATKFACIGMHEALHCELQAHGHDFVKMTCVCPYFINTGMFTGCRPRLFPMLEPSFVAEETVKAVQKNKVLCVLPDSGRILLPLKSWMPAKVNWELMSRVLRLPESMRLYSARGRAQSG